MPYLTKEEIAQAMKQANTGPKLTEEQKALLKENGAKVTRLTYKERRAIRMKEYEENGFI